MYSSINLWSGGVHVTLSQFHFSSMRKNTNVIISDIYKFIIALHKLNDIHLFSQKKKHFFRGVIMCVFGVFWVIFPSVYLVYLWTDTHNYYYHRCSHFSFNWSEFEFECLYSGCFIRIEAFFSLVYFVFICFYCYSIW